MGPSAHLKNSSLDFGWSNTITNESFVSYPEFGAQDFLVLFLEDAIQYTKVCQTVGFVISLIGLIFNFFCYHTSLSLPTQSTSTVLMSYLAIWDTISEVHDGILDNGFKRLFDLHLEDLHPVMCKLFYYQSWASTLNASSHLVALAVDRVLSIIFPVWHHNLLILPTAKKISLACTIFCYLSVLPNFYIFGLRDDLCMITYSEEPELLDFYQKFINYGLFSAGPSILIFLSNIVFIIKLRIIRQTSKKNCGKNKIILPSKADNGDQLRLLTSEGERSKQTSSSPFVTQNSELSKTKESTYIAMDDFSTTVDNQKKLTDQDLHPISGKLETDVDAALEKSNQFQSDEGFDDLYDGIYIKPGVYVSTNFTTNKPDVGKPSLDDKTPNDDDVIKNPRSEVLQNGQVGGDEDGSTLKPNVEVLPDLQQKKSLIEEENKRNKVDRSVVFMLLSVCCTYLVFTASSGALNILGHISVSSDFGKDMKKFLRSAAEVPCIMNNSLNFVFYFFCGQSFRKTFKHKYIPSR